MQLHRGLCDCGVKTLLQRTTEGTKTQDFPGPSTSFMYFLVARTVVKGQLGPM